MSGYDIWLATEPREEPELPPECPYCGGTTFHEEDCPHPDWSPEC